MLFDVLMLILRMFATIAAAGVLFFGFAYFIALGDANGRGKMLVSRGFDGVVALVLYLSWFGLLWRFGFSQWLFMVACGAAVVLGLIYAASYQTAQARAGS